MYRARSITSVQAIDLDKYLSTVNPVLIALRSFQNSGDSIKLIYE